MCCAEFSLKRVKLECEGEGGHPSLGDVGALSGEENANFRAGFDNQRVARHFIIR